MAKNKDVAEMFAEGKQKGEANNMFIEGNTIYSYGFHFPIAIRLWDGNEWKFVWNRDKYSMTTSRHQNYVLRAIKGKIIKEVNTQEMEKYKKFINIKEALIEALE